MPKKLNTETFIQRAIEIHGNIYDYSKVNYINSSQKVIIICKIHGEFTQRAGSHISGNACYQCAIINCSNKLKYNNEIFIQKAKRIHGNKYDYSCVNYINSKIKVKIICKIHGEFEITPSSFIKGSNCNLCINRQKLTIEEFIKRAIKIHGNLYDYSNVDYININTKVMIFCKEHNEYFLQSPNSHLSGSACWKCGIIKGSNKKRSNTEEFIKKAIKIHGNRYDYSYVDYKHTNKKVIIICKEHGSFTQTPHNHLVFNCLKCSGNEKGNTEEFIKKSIKIHGNKYDYSKVNYINNNIKIILICKKHKQEFTQSPNNHLSGNICPRCSINNFSKLSIQWLELISKLNNIYIQHALNDGEYKIEKTKYKADGYCKETNTIYEFHGDYWHGNPKLYNSNKLNKTNKKTYGELYQNTLKKEELIKKLGYNLVVIWESKWIKIIKSIIFIQKQFRYFHNHTYHNLTIK